RADAAPGDLRSFPTRRSSDLRELHEVGSGFAPEPLPAARRPVQAGPIYKASARRAASRQPDEVAEPAAEDLSDGISRPSSGVHRSEEHTSELQSRETLVCRHP